VSRRHATLAFSGLVDGRYVPKLEPEPLAVILRALHLPAYGLHRRAYGLLSVPGGNVPDKRKAAPLHGKRLSFTSTDSGGLSDQIK
jgi:hypothetical protein